MTAGGVFDLLLAASFIVLSILSAGNPAPTMTDRAMTTTRQLASILHHAASDASNSPDGETVIITPDGPQHTLVRTYRNRPDTTQGPLTDQQVLQAPIALTNGDTTFALAVAHDGSTTSIDPFTTWTDAAAGSTACSTITLIFGAGNETVNATLSCNDSAVAIPAPTPTPTGTP
jgi:hypothetical protein